MFQSIEIPKYLHHLLVFILKNNQKFISTSYHEKVFFSPWKYPIYTELKCLKLIIDFPHGAHSPTALYWKYSKKKLHFYVLPTIFSSTFHVAQFHQTISMEKNQRNKRKFYSNLFLESPCSPFKFIKKIKFHTNKKKIDKKMKRKSFFFLHISFCTL